MNNFIDLTGQRFGRWVVLRRADPPLDKTNHPLWHCKCDCGTEADVIGYSLRTGRSRSCGCLSRELASQRFIRHGDSFARLYNTWKAMRGRCYNKNAQDYQHYGGRGIRVCDEWMSYPAFKTWALASGYTDSLTLDRIDVNGDYEPSNCRWVSMHEQILNRRVTRWYTMDGQTMCLKDWARTFQIDYCTLRQRIQRGWDFETAVRTPAHHRQNAAKGRKATHP